MANSIKTFTWGAGDTALTNFALPNHFEQADIKVFVNGDLKIDGTDYTYNTTTINFNNNYLPAENDVITIERNTQNNERLVDFSDGSILKADTLDKDSNQIFYMAQEAYDKANFTNTASGKFYYSQGEAPTDPTNGTLWYNTSSTPNVLQVYNGTSWVAAVPTKATHLITTSSNGYYDVANNPSSSTFAKIFLYGKYDETHSNVYLNGVKLVKAAQQADIPASADYYYNSASDFIHLMPLLATDVLTIETLEGSFVTDAATVQAHVDAYNNTYLPRMITSDGLAQDSINANNQINQTLTDMGGLSGALSDSQSNALAAQKYANHTGTFNVTIDGTQYTAQLSAKHYSDLAASTVNTAVNTTIPNLVTSAEGTIDTAESTAISAIQTQQSTSVSAVNSVSSNVLNNATLAEQHKNSALSSKQAAEAAANATQDVLNGWAVVSNNVISTYGSDDTQLISSTNLDITAPSGVTINAVPTPKFAFVLDLANLAQSRDSVAVPPQGGNFAYSEPVNGTFRVSLGNHPASPYYYANTNDYQVQAYYQENTNVNIKVNRSTEYFEVTVADANGAAVQSGELFVFVYEF